VHLLVCYLNTSNNITSNTIGQLTIMYYSLEKNIFLVEFVLRLKDFFF